MRVLITGAAGFIGSHLAERLEQDGHQVAGMDNLTTGRNKNYPSIPHFDLADRHMIYDFANAVAPEFVIHCAASYSDPDLWHRDTDTNVTGTINATLVAKHHNAKLIYFQTALPPISSYAISKIAGEQYIKLSDVPSLIFRLSNIYGPRNVSGPVPAFYKRLVAGERCTVVDTVRDMVYVDDLTECVMKAISEDRIGTFDVCSGIPVSILGVYEQVAAHFDGTLEPRVEDPHTDDVMPQTSVHDWLRGWAPKTQLKDGVKSAVEWYRENGVGETYTHLKVAS